MKTRLVVTAALLIGLLGLAPGVSAIGTGMTARVGSVRALPHVPRGITGQVTIGPTSPLCRAAPCLPRPFQTTLTITGHGRTVTVETGADGRYAVRLPRGMYVVRGCGVGIFSRSVSATVSARGMTVANLACDTGIR